MIYWGIDPGPEKCGIAMIRNDKPFGFEIPTSQLTDHYVPFPINVVDGEYYSPKKVRVGVEMVGCMGQRVGREVFDTVLVIGRIMQCFEPYARVALFERTEIKRYFGVVPKGKSADSQIRTAMIERWGEPGTAKNPGPTYGISGHVWQALAVATCVYDKERNK